MKYVVDFTTTASLTVKVEAADPEAALIDYLTEFAKAAPADFSRVAALTPHADWMHQVTGVTATRSAVAAPARTQAPAAKPEAEPATGCAGRLNLFAKRQSERDRPEDEGGEPDSDGVASAPFEEAPAQRRMRMR